MEFARKNAGANTWTRVTFTCPAGSFGCVNGTASSWAGTGGKGLPTDNPAGTQPRAEERPGLAYQKRAGQPNNYVGRFYIAINQQSSCSEPFGTPNNDDGTGAGCSSRLIMTEGNLASGTPATRRLAWITPAHWLANKFAVGGISLVDDLTRDTNLRAAFADPGGSGLFEPLADGIINASLSDLDDFPYVSGALRAAICMDGGTWPYQCTLPPNLP